MPLKIGFKVPTGPARFIDEGFGYTDTAQLGLLKGEDFQITLESNSSARMGLPHLPPSCQLLRPQQKDL